MAHTISSDLRDATTKSTVSKLSIAEDKDLVSHMEMSSLLNSELKAKSLKEDIVKTATQQVTSPGSGRQSNQRSPIPSDGPRITVNEEVYEMILKAAAELDSLQDEVLRDGGLSPGGSRGPKWGQFTQSYDIRAKPRDGETQEQADARVAAMMPTSNKNTLKPKVHTSEDNKAQHQKGPNAPTSPSPQPRKYARRVPFVLPKFGGPPVTARVKPTEPPPPAAITEQPETEDSTLSLPAQEPVDDIPVVHSVTEFTLTVVSPPPAAPPPLPPSPTPHPSPTRSAISEDGSVVESVKACKFSRVSVIPILSRTPSEPDLTEELSSETIFEPATEDLNLDPEPEIQEVDPEPGTEPGQEILPASVKTPRRRKRVKAVPTDAAATVSSPEVIEKSEPSEQHQSTDRGQAYHKAPYSVNKTSSSGITSHNVSTLGAVSKQGRRSIPTGHLLAAIATVATSGVNQDISAGAPSAPVETPAAAASTSESKAAQLTSLPTDDVLLERFNAEEDLVLAEEAEAKRTGKKVAKKCLVPRARSSSSDLKSLMVNEEDKKRAPRPSSARPPPKPANNQGWRPAGLSKTSVSSFKYEAEPYKEKRSIFAEARKEDPKQSKGKAPWRPTNVQAKESVAFKYESQPYQDPKPFTLREDRPSVPNKAHHAAAKARPRQKSEAGHAPPPGTSEAGAGNQEIHVEVGGEGPSSSGITAFQSLQRLSRPTHPPPPRHPSSPPRLVRKPSSPRPPPLAPKPVGKSQYTFDPRDCPIPPRQYNVQADGPLYGAWMSPSGHQDKKLPVMEWGEYSDKWEVNPLIPGAFAKTRSITPTSPPKEKAKQQLKTFQHPKRRSPDDRTAMPLSKVQTVANLTSQSMFSRGTIMTGLASTAQFAKGSVEQAGRLVRVKRPSLGFLNPGGTEHNDGEDGLDGLAPGVVREEENVLIQAPGKSAFSVRLVTYRKEDQVVGIAMQLPMIDEQWEYRLEGGLSTYDITTQEGKAQLLSTSLAKVLANKAKHAAEAQARLAHHAEFEQHGKHGQHANGSRPWDGASHSHQARDHHGEWEHHSSYPDPDYEYVVEDEYEEEDDNGEWEYYYSDEEEGAHAAGAAAAAGKGQQQVPGGKAAGSKREKAAVGGRSPSSSALEEVSSEVSGRRFERHLAQPNPILLLPRLDHPDLIRGIARASMQANQKSRPFMNPPHASSETAFQQRVHQAGSSTSKVRSSELPRHLPAIQSCPVFTGAKPHGFTHSQHPPPAPHHSSYHSQHPPAPHHSSYHSASLDTKRPIGIIEEEEEEALEPRERSLGPARQAYLATGMAAGTDQHSVFRPADPLISLCTAFQGRLAAQFSQPHLHTSTTSLNTEHSASGASRLKADKTGILPPWGSAALNSGLLPQNWRFEDQSMSARLFEVASPPPPLPELGLHGRLKLRHQPLNPVDLIMQKVQAPAGRRATEGFPQSITALLEPSLMEEEMPEPKACRALTKMPSLQKMASLTRDFDALKREAASKPAAPPSWSASAAAAAEAAAAEVAAAAAEVLKLTEDLQAQRRKQAEASNAVAAALTGISQGATSSASTHAAAAAAAATAALTRHSMQLQMEPSTSSLFSQASVSSGLGGNPVNNSLPKRGPLRVLGGEVLSVILKGESTSFLSPVPVFGRPSCYELGLPPMKPDDTE
ncbi:hypothetical protein CEUSTIGMA_g6670.t1 [Chlamydomonas eustigma]|uniref:Uncharacterized protein n=1 Tax=Chlamydomonas eustigma TaxID=1157962 RepID=A0A250X8X8_9CHLO|nr:hypothetical protein CEUSTIGMA_g6670.t1 [Chlamydomonas eustigma]|eukprot:GAX79230.1 hypothetical protein CEUSTIGMA_g6670.t1 [Chlamydomonas eustigma]